MTDNGAGTDTGAQSSRITRLFDIRLIVGGLLTVYGVVLLVMSFWDSSEDIAKGAGIRLNLWTGIGLLVVGLGMLLWMRLAPLRAEPDRTGSAGGPAEPRA
ncbi:hypothetical protein [Nakamurella endophytica]|uniref:Uncharacterized protein n=1 Tax=Nakamurella endophytica TaxID=1748367 RepID=A0A917WEY5_9ACTN|nr:hypothetical protein [Nakamurella endophytica]GGL98532.1 hypothetical protein GCM10011594_18040 [Nakamurella endophytica]